MENFKVPQWEDKYRSLTKRERKKRRRKTKDWRQLQRSFLKRLRLCCLINPTGRFEKQKICKTCIKKLREAKRKMNDRNWRGFYLGELNIEGL